MDQDFWNVIFFSVSELVNTSTSGEPSTRLQCGGVLAAQQAQGGRADHQHVHGPGVLGIGANQAWNKQIF